MKNWFVYYYVLAGGIDDLRYGYGQALKVDRSVLI